MWRGQVLIMMVDLHGNQLHPPAKTLEITVAALSHHHGPLPMVLTLLKGGKPLPMPICDDDTPSCMISFASLVGAVKRVRAEPFFCFVRMVALRLASLTVSAVGTLLRRRTR